MATRVEMPKPGEVVEECLLARWVKVAGDRVSPGDVLAEIETDKAIFEVSAPVGGVLLETFVPAGEVVPVYSTICAIGAPGESVAEFAPTAPAGGRAGDAAAEAPPRAASPVDTVPTSGAPARGAVSPRARRFARKYGIDTSGIRGSGPGGRILEEDVRRQRDASPPSPHAAAVPPPVADLGRAGGAMAATGLGGSETALSPFRDTIARRLRQSLASTAQYTLNGSADATALLALRGRIKARAKDLGLPDITINDLVLFATVQALRRMGALNAELRDGRVRRHDRIHLGFACDTERGLVVPVVRDAHGMTLVDLSVAVKQLADRAVAGTLAPDLLSGATFTVSNLGSLGVESFTPILNPPQVAILGVNAIAPRMVRRGDKIEIVDRIGLSLTCDHQVIDGAPGARFLGVVRECLESVDSLCGLDV